ncbi:multiple epidermal growth factor-like domains protein 11 [Saccostrea cucullata]|uniref:multiple epidermal growth factor-like domains protein 11 n=1 Tax=Saccostrea cuccullata TaxID=36930 RepID=UPI002ED1CAC8
MAVSCRILFCALMCTVCVFKICLTKELSTSTGEACKEWNPTDNGCSECKAGYFGPNCLPCRYPNYGKGCQMFCNCEMENCSYITGCCSVGYFGLKCELPCRYPNYGNGCQSECLCVQQLCDHINGCKECPPGFVGESCQQNCSYPRYGENCQLECKCREEQCDFVTGCKAGRKENCISTEDEKRGSNAMISTAIVLTLIAIIQFTFYVYFSMFYKPRLLYITKF